MTKVQGTLNVLHSVQIKAHMYMEKISGSYHMILII